MEKALSTSTEKEKPEKETENWVEAWELRGKAWDDIIYISQFPRGSNFGCG